MSHSKKVLTLGAGMCSHPAIHYFEAQGYQQTVASRTLKNAQKQIQGCKLAQAVQLDVGAADGEEKLRELAKQGFHVVVSLLPYLLHPRAAKVALELGLPFVAPSYVSDGIRALEEEAKRLKLPLVMECGVDPGTDHGAAMKIIHDVHERGGKLVFFTSYAGGLPAPHDEEQNPFGYKFSWAPRGVLLAGQNDASFYQHGDEVRIDGKDLFERYWSFQVEGFEPMEVYPNRDSKPYREIYGIPEVRTLIRGTLRNKGWCQKIKKLVDLGYIETEEHSDLEGLTYGELTRKLSGAGPDVQGDSLVAHVAEKLGVAQDSHVIKAYEWLGLFGSEKVPACNTTLDALCDIMQRKMPLGKNDRDLMLLRHTMIAEFKDHTEYITSTLVDYGTAGGETSMARTTSLPMAIATKLVLEGRFQTPGISTMVDAHLYRPIMAELSDLGISYKDVVQSIPKAHKSDEFKKREKKLYKKFYGQAYEKEYARLMKK